MRSNAVAEIAQLPRNDHILHGVENVLEVLGVGGARNEWIYSLLLVVDAVDKLGADVLRGGLEGILTCAEVSISYKCLMALSYPCIPRTQR